MKFISSNTETIAHKKKVHRACASCRRRKRRCTHTLDSNVAETSNDSPHTPTSPSASTGLDLVSTTRSPKHHQQQHGRHSSATESTTSEASGANSRSSRVFIGSLNPESVFRSAANPEIAVRGKPYQDSMGTWLVDSLRSSETQETVDNHTVKLNGIFFNSSLTTQTLLSSLLEEECFSVLPPASYLSQLLSFYAEEIHPLLPLVDVKSFQTGIDHNSKILLSQAMCLLASTNHQCKTLLCLPGENELLPPRVFGRRIFSAMRCAIELGAVTNRMVLIQALGPLSLFTEGPEGSEIAGQNFSKMVQLVHTLGLHIQRGDEGEDEYEVTSLCCVWALDRLNAAIHGKPVLMHERDINRDLRKCFESQKPAFRLLLLVIAQLDQVIDLYRPRSSSNAADIDFKYPLFEELVVSAQCVNLHARLLNTIETLYYAVAILSCRSMEKSSNNHVRQNFAASRINSIVGQAGQNQVILVPFIPYAVSLSLSISYKQMRYTKVALYRARAREELQSTCALLDQLGSQFYMASIIAKLGKATIAEMDRVSHSNTNTTESSTVSHGHGHGANLDLSATANATELDNPDIDVFDMFDPNFGLEDIDAVFQSNLDLSMPMYLPPPNEGYDVA